MRDKEYMESISLDLLQDWRNGNRSDFRSKVNELNPMEALYCGLIILDYMQSSDGELEKELFVSEVYPD